MLVFIAIDIIKLQGKLKVKKKRDSSCTFVRVICTTQIDPYRVNVYSYVYQSSEAYIMN